MDIYQIGKDIAKLENMIVSVESRLHYLEEYVLKQQAQVESKDSNENF